jgi:hypothetical protein
MNEQYEKTNQRKGKERPSGFSHTIARRILTFEGTYDLQLQGRRTEFYIALSEES